MKFRMTISLMALFALFACAKERSFQQTPRGGLRVTVQGADPEQVQKIVVELAPLREGGTPYEVPLRRQEGSTSWETLIVDILVDAYVVTARAYDTLHADTATAEPLLTSHPVQVIIPINDVASVFLVMSDDIFPEQPAELPFFASVVLSQEKVEQWETLDITVSGGGGKQPLVASGRTPVDELPMNRGEFSEAQELFFGDGTVGFASLSWTPPRNDGVRTLILRLVDAKNNAVEMLVQVQVGKNIGSLEFDFAFHLAPGLELVRSETSSVDDGVSFFGWIEVLDDLSREKPAQRSYAWEHAGCGGRFEAGGGAASGVFIANDPTEPGAMFFHYFIPDAKRPEDGSCEMGFTLTEWNQVDVDLEAGVSSELRFELVTEQLEPSTP